MHKLKKLDRIYAQLPKIKCQKKCYMSCGPIDMTKIERQRIIDNLGFDPFLPVTALIEQLTKTPNLGALTCPLLNQKTKKCTIYDIRPFICRLYGLVKRMTCPYGCKPERYLTSKEAVTIQLKIESIKNNGSYSLIGKNYEI